MHPRPLPLQLLLQTRMSLLPLPLPTLPATPAPAPNFARFCCGSMSLVTKCSGSALPAASRNMSPRLSLPSSPSAPPHDFSSHLPPGAGSLGVAPVTSNNLAVRQLSQLAFVSFPFLLFQEEFGGEEELSERVLSMMMWHFIGEG